MHHVYSLGLTGLDEHAVTS